MVPLNQFPSRVAYGVPCQISQTLPSRTEPPRGRFVSLSAEKLRGGYYTPGNLANWLSRWAIRSPTDSFLEPGCGDGAILTAAAARLRDLGCTAAALPTQVQGVELLPKEAAIARGRLVAFMGSAAREAVATADLFAWWAQSLNGKRFSAVVGNPPFIRYQSFPEPARSRAMAIMKDFGLRPNRLTNIWVPFVVLAVESLECGGRLCFVLPAELLQVSYAKQLRSFLCEKFESVNIITCNQLIFEGAEQEVLLLLADGARAAGNPNNKCAVKVVEFATLADLLASDPRFVLNKCKAKSVDTETGEKWLKYFLDAKEIGLMRALRSHRDIVDLGQLAEIDVGIVTGANSFFVLRGSELKNRKLNGLARRLISRSAHLRGAIVSDVDWMSLTERDERVHLLDIRAPKRFLSDAADAYIAEGERAGVHKGYKCSIRNPWYQVPAVWEPDAFLFRQIHDFPKLVLNAARAASTDTIHRMRSRGYAASSIVAGVYTHLTAASAEIEGRSYGGGVLELEPTEAERLLVPSGARLVDALPLSECDALLRNGRLHQILQENDSRILRGSLGLSSSECATLAGIWDKMKTRRVRRRRRTDHYS